MINLFIPNTLDGSAAAIAAHIYAGENNGAVSIVRYRDDSDLNQAVGELMRHITVADGFDAPQPEKRFVWIVGEYISEMIDDELSWFAHHKPGRMCDQFPKGRYLYISKVLSPTSCPSVNHFFFHLSDNTEASQNIRLLYSMLDHDEFEHLMAYLLQQHPTAEDVTKEDYVLSLFIEHAKKKKQRL